MDEYMHNYLMELDNKKKKKKRILNDPLIPPDKSKHYIDLSTGHFVCKICSTFEDIKKNTKNLSNNEYMIIRKDFKLFKAKHKH